MVFSTDATSTAAPPRTRTTRRPDPWQSADFRLLMVGTLAAVLGNWIQQIGQGWYVLQITGSAFDLALVQAASALPMLLFGLLGGVVADRVDRRRLVTFTRTAIAVLSLLLALLIWQGLAPLPVILIIVGTTGIFWAFDMPARQAMAPQLVQPEARTSAIAWLSTVMNAGRILGPAVGGILLGFVGVAGCIVASAVGFFFMAGMTSRIRPLPATPVTVKRDVASEMLVGLRYVVQNPTILALLLLIAASVVFWQSHVVLLPVFARDVLGTGASGYGILSAASGAGALAGALFVATVLPPRRQGWMLASFGIAAAILLPIWSMMTGFVASLVLLLIATALGTATQTLATTLLQRQAPNHLQGRVMSVVLLTWGLTPLGLLLVGALADLGGAPFAVVVASSITLASTAAIFLIAPGLRRL